MQPSFRAFFAIEIPDEIKKIILTKIKPLQTDRTLTKIKWLKPANWHITLCFLGNISPEQYQCIDQKIKAVIESTNSFSITLAKLLPFPSAEKFRVINLEPRAGAELITLALSIRHSVATCDIPVEKRPFIPHLTLGRINDKSTGKHQFFNQIELPAMSFEVTAVKLFKSAAGSVYTVINSYDLRTSNDIF